MSGMFLTTPPSIPSNLLTQHSSPSQSAPPLIMQNQQDTHFQQGSSKPIKFKNERYPNPRTYPPHFSLIVSNDSSGNNPAPSTNTSTSLPSFRLV